MGTKIIVDSSCGISKELALSTNIEILPMPVQIGGVSFYDGVDITMAEFYRRMRQGETAKTSSPSPGDFLRAWRPHLEAGDRIIQVLLSSRASSAVQVARTTAQEESPGMIDIIDSLSLTYLEAFVALAGAQVLLDGGDHRAAIQAMQVTIPRQFAFLTMPTLSYLNASGRVTKGQAILASLFNIKVVLGFEQGELEVLEKIRSFSQALNRVAELTAARLAGQKAELVILHCDCPDTAAEMQQRLAERAKCPVSLVCDAGPIIAAHIGPGTIVVGVKLG